MQFRLYSYGLNVSLGFRSALFGNVIYGVPNPRT